ncbi:MAG: T9SS C-terminal target domain-containing protein [Haliscomenobacteraceae bacterium CHB4]|nr:hypothetical protein [Saprospiraceae bacterium]MCE7926359.1 T9SS C-terminal target domain-containing protein [Haliscomenobacteraceae bacterium CHB4]
MKTVLLSFVCFFLSEVLVAQKHDYVWVAGDGNTMKTTTHGGMTINFNQNPVDVYYNYREHNLFTTNTSICDTAGKLLFYTNGCVIAGAYDDVLENGDNINPGSSHTLWCEDYDDGYAGGPQNSLILPLPDSMGVYFLFHKSFTIYSNPFDVINDKLMYSVIDMNLNNSMGKVTKKNENLILDTLAHGEIVSVKCANGQDWWLITPRRNSATFYILKFTNQGIVDTFIQTIGIWPNPDGEATGQMVFSPDGSKLYRTNRFDPIMVYSFNRESGVFTQFDTIHYDYGNQFVGEIGCAVSPSGRFLYLGCRKFLYQVDLWASDISASQTVVAEWDGYANPIAPLFWQLQLGPDCKIYGQAGDTRFYHVIHNPDEPGMACNAEQRGLPLPTPSGASMPSFPNYRLGPIDNPGVPCTATVSAGNPPPTPLPPLSVFPNPASSYLKIIVNRPLPAGAQWTLYDAYGRVARTERLVNEVTCTEITVEGLAAGVYFWELKGKEGLVIQSGKILKM